MTVIIGGDSQIVDDVLELDADCLTFHSTRRDDWNAHVQQSPLAEMGLHLELFP